MTSPRLAVLFLVAACSSSSPAPPATPPAAPAASPLVTVETRDHLLRVWSAPGGPRFTVEDHAGRVLARDLDPALLAREWPLLHDAWQTGVAAPVHADVAPADREL